MKQVFLLLLFFVDLFLQMKGCLPSFKNLPNNADRYLVELYVKSKKLGLLTTNQTDDGSIELSIAPLCQSNENTFYLLADSPCTNKEWAIIIASSVDENWNGFYLMRNNESNVEFVWRNASTSDQLSRDGGCWTRHRNHNRNVTGNSNLFQNQFFNLENGHKHYIKIDVGRRGEATLKLAQFEESSTKKCGEDCKKKFNFFTCRNATKTMSRCLL